MESQTAGCARVRSRSTVPDDKSQNHSWKKSGPKLLEPEKQRKLKKHDLRNTTLLGCWDFSSYWSTTNLPIYLLTLTITQQFSKRLLRQRPSYWFILGHYFAEVSSYPKNTFMYSVCSHSFKNKKSSISYSLDKLRPRGVRLELFNKKPSSKMHDPKSASQITN